MNKEIYTSNKKARRNSRSLKQNEERVERARKEKKRKTEERLLLTC